MKKRVDRKVHMEQNILPLFNRLILCLNWTVQEIEACCFSPTDYINEGYKVNMQGEHFRISEVRILRSHANAVKVAKSETSVNHVLVLEDDVSLNMTEDNFFRSIVYVFSQLNNIKWGIVKVGYWPILNIANFENIKLIHGCSMKSDGAFAYFVNGGYRSKYWQKLDNSWKFYLENSEPKQADNIMFPIVKDNEERDITMEFFSLIFNMDDCLGNSQISHSEFELDDGAPITFHLEPRVFGHTQGWSDNWLLNRTSKRRLLNLTSSSLPSPLLPCHC